MHADYSQRFHFLWYSCYWWSHRCSKSHPSNEQIATYNRQWPRRKVRHNSSRRSAFIASSFQTHLSQWYGQDLVWWMLPLDSSSKPFEGGGHDSSFHFWRPTSLNDPLPPCNPHRIRFLASACITSVSLRMVHALIPWLATILCLHRCYNALRNHHELLYRIIGWCNCC